MRHRVLGLGLVAVGLAAVGTASAQTTGTPQLALGLVTRSKAQHTVNPLWISQSDCDAGDVFTFPLTKVSYNNTSSTYSLEVWVGPGTDCSDKIQRYGGSATCSRIYRNANPGQPTVTLTFSDAQLLGALNGASTSPPTTCSVPEDYKTGTQTLAVYFMFVDTASASYSPVSSSIKFSVGGPNPPTAISAESGESMIRLKWTPNTDVNVAGYYVYCDPAPPEMSEQTVCVPIESTSTTETDASTSTSTTSTRTSIGKVRLALPLGSEADAETTDAQEDALATGEAGDDASDAASASEASTRGDESTPDATANPTPESTPDSGSDATSSSATCPEGTKPATCFSNILSAGDTPNEAYRCGRAEGYSSSGTNVTSYGGQDLVNGKQYTFAVATYDKIGNLGKLSELGCGTPHEIVDFKDAYEAAGGSMGSGFCAVRTPDRRNTGLASLVAVALGVAVRTLRRRSRRAAGSSDNA